MTRPLEREAEMAPLRFASFVGLDIDPAGEEVVRGQIVWVPIHQLAVATYNPRYMSRRELKKLMDSLREFGMVEPAVVNSYPGREEVLVGGHQRVKAAAKLKWTHVPCVYVYVNPTREKLLNLALNRISGEWDQEKLADVFEELAHDDTLDAAADLHLSGFDRKEIDELLAADAASSGDANAPPLPTAAPAQLIVSAPAESYDPAIGDAIAATVASLQVRFAGLTLTRKGGA